MMGIRNPAKSVGVESIMLLTIIKYPRHRKELDTIHFMKKDWLPGDKTQFPCKVNIVIIFSKKNK